MDAPPGTSGRNSRSFSLAIPFCSIRTRLQDYLRVRSLSQLFFSSMLLVNFANAQPANIHQQVQQTYNFQPPTLSSAEINQKSGVLDQFWAKAKSEPNVYVPALRQELSDFRNSPFFLYDGSMLLLSLSDTATYRKLSLAAIARSDLRCSAKRLFLASPSNGESG
jgi:hypothetical protein